MQGGPCRAPGRKIIRQIEGVIPGRAELDPGIHGAARMLGETGSGFALRVPRNDDCQISDFPKLRLLDFRISEIMKLV